MLQRKLPCLHPFLHHRCIPVPPLPNPSVPRPAYRIFQPPSPKAAADVSASMQLDLSGQTSSGFKLNFDIKELDLVCRI
jgi:hypothetical protein